MNDKKLRREIAALDIVIILVVLLALSSIVIRAVDLNRTESREYSTATVSFTVRGVRKDIEYNVFNGDAVRLVAGDVYMGQIIGELDIVPTDSEGLESEIYCDLFGEMAVVGFESDLGYYIRDALYISPGSRLTVCTENVEFTIEILDILTD